MFQLLSDQNYMMPAHFGPRANRPKSSGWYRDVTAMVVSYVTDREKLAAYIPAPYKVAEDAIVTVVYACNKNIDWLAGRGYNLLGVHAAVTYEGKKETLAGNYALVMWENLTDPILTGRELQGIPKVYADIAEHKITDGRWSVGASHFDHSIVDLSIINTRPPTAEEIQLSMAKAEGKDNPLGWRYIPAVGGQGHALVEPTTFPSENNITQAWVGEGEINWKTLTWEQNPTQYHIVNALAGLPVLSYLPALITKGSANLIVPERPPRALR